MEMVPKTKTYYTYIVFDAHCNFYIGSASCYGNPEDHNYYGSGSAIRSGEFVPIRKRVINTYASRGLAGKAEQALIALADPKNNPVCFNKLCAGSDQTDEKARKISEALSGKSHSEAHKAKNSEAKKGENNPMFGKPSARRDPRLHKFKHEDGREIVGLYVELKTNAKQIFGFSASPVQSLKEGYRQSVNGWSYCGVIGNG